MIVLDTHIWLWWLHDPARISTRARALVERGERDSVLRVSSISVWEVAVKVQLGKLALPMEIGAWYSSASRYPGLTVEPLDPLDALGSTLLPGTFHTDSADRIIVAMARRYGATLVSCDQKIRDYPHVDCVW